MAAKPAASLLASPEALLDGGAGGRGDAACQRLFELYRDGDDGDRAAVSAVLPDLVLALLWRRDRPVGVAAVLVAVYGRARREQTEGRGPFDSFAATLPDVSAPSVYHAGDAKGADERKAAGEGATAAADGEGGACLPPLGSMSDGTALRVALACLAVYVEDIGSAGRESHARFCRACERLCGPGPPSGRVPLSRPLLHVMARGVSYCAAYEWSRAPALDAMRALHLRATEELWPDVMLTTTCALETADAAPA